MDESNNYSEDFALFKTDIEARSHELMEHLETSRCTFWENLHACRDYVIGQVNYFFSELEAEALNEQKAVDEKAQELGMHILNTLEKIEACVSNIDACKQSLKRLSVDAHIPES